MIEAPATIRPVASLKRVHVRRRRPLRLPAPVFAAPVPIVREAPARGWAADLRFFAICYLAGFIFFLIMLS